MIKQKKKKNCHISQHGQNWPKLLKMGQNGPTWPKLHNMVKIAQNGSKWLNMAQNGQKGRGGGGVWPFSAKDFVIFRRFSAIFACFC
jgi:hypothetical protein